MSNKVSVIKPRFVASSSTASLCRVIFRFMFILICEMWPSPSGYSKNQPSIQSDKNTISQIYIKVSLFVMHPSCLYLI